MKRFAWRIILMVLTGIVLAQLGVAQSSDKSSRSESKKAIRAVTYEAMRGLIAGDTKSFRQQVTQRTIDFLKLAYEVCSQDPEFQKQLSQYRIANADEFLDFMLRESARAFAGNLSASPDKSARMIADESWASFINDSEAKIYVGNSGSATEIARAKLIEGRWKIDLTDIFKKGILDLIKNPDMKAKIKNF